MKTNIAAVLLFCSRLAMGGNTPPSEAPVSIGVMKLDGVITERSVAPMIEVIQAVNSTSNPISLIRIDIDSPGGEVDAGFALSKAIEKSTVPVVCVVDGHAASMAFYVLQSCHVRLATPRSALMMHEVTMFGAIRSSNIEYLRRQMEVYNAGMVGHCAAKMKLTEAEVADKIKHGDWWLNPKEAVEIGAIDKIVPVSVLN